MNTNAKAATSSTVAVAFVLLVTSASQSATAETRIAVVDADTDSGVKSTIMLIKNKIENNVGESDDAGVAAIPEYKCDLGDVFYAAPHDPAYYKKSKGISCNTSKPVIKVRRIIAERKILDRANTYQQAGDFGKAAQAYNELHATQPNKDYNRKTLEAVATALDIDPNTALVADPQQNKLVPSRELIDRVIVFQQENNLPATGVIGAKTLEKLAGGTVARNVLK